MIDFKEVVAVESQEERTKIYQEDLDNYSAWLSENVNSEEDVQAEEKRLIEEEMQPVDDYIRSREYTLPAGVGFEGKNMTKKDVFAVIAELIGRQDVKLEYIRGLYDMVKFWEATPEKVSYPVLDSTLRALQSLSFKGVDNWRRVLIFVQYFDKLSDEYRRDIQLQNYCAYKHNELIKRNELVKPRTEATEPIENIESIMGPES